MAENIDGPGWEIVRPRPGWDRSSVIDIGSLLPQTNDFWYSLQRYCVPGCCGLDAYDFDPEFVRWAAHLANDQVGTPPGWRPDEPVDAPALALELRRASEQVRAIDADAVDATELFNEMLAPASYADLLGSLAAALEAG